MKGLVKNFKKLATFCSLVVIVAASNASATTTYNFSTTGFGQNLYRPGDNLYVGAISNLSTSTIVYDEVTKIARLTISGKANVNTRADSGVIGGVIASNVDYSFVMDFFNVIPITNPAGLLGFLGVGASSQGTFTVANIGDVTGDGITDSANYTTTAKFMNFAGAATDGITDYRDELSHLGSANFFLWNSITYGGLAAKAWLSSANNVFINGALRTDLFDSTGGDVHLTGGTQNTTIPEPATALLLGLGALGRAAVRKRQAA